MLRSIGSMMTHLPEDDRAVYRELMVEGEPLQSRLRQSWPATFDGGRLREIFMVRLLPCSPMEAPELWEGIRSDTGTLWAIYGCQDACCLYVFAEVIRSNSTVMWTRVGVNRRYAGLRKGDGIHWLEGWEPLAFEVHAYEAMERDFGVV